MMLNFMGALDLDYHSFFECPLCSDHPEVIIADCKQMGYQIALGVPYHRPVDADDKRKFTM
jgi:hypothetical protein